VGSPHASWRGAGATRERQARGAPEPDYLVRLGNKEGRGLHAVEVRIVDVRDGHHHALLEDLGRSRGKVRRYKSIRRRLIASAIAQRSARRAVDHQHATAHTHPGRACQGGRRERRYQGAHLRIGIECRGALVGCGSCSSIGVTGTVQMRASGSVRSIMPARRILFVGCLEMAWRVCACGGFITAYRGKWSIPQNSHVKSASNNQGNYRRFLASCRKKPYFPIAPEAPRKRLTVLLWYGAEDPRSGFRVPTSCDVLNDPDRREGAILQHFVRNQRLTRPTSTAPHRGFKRYVLSF